MSNPIADLIRAQLGIVPKALEQLSDQIEKLDLDESESLRLAGAVNAELARIYAERHVAEAMHRVAHDRRQIDPDSRGKPNGWANVTTQCPDCGRFLVAARDEDAPVHPVLVCSRLHGLSVRNVVGLTAHDVVACGLGG